MPRTHLALLRGINLGAANKVPMAELRSMATRLGWGDVDTHVNSGNLVFSSTGELGDLEEALAAELAAYLGKRIEVLVVTAQEWIDAVEQCPYAPTEDKFVHVQVHRRPVPGEVVTAISEEAAQADDGTEVTARGRWLYLHTPYGLSKSAVFTRAPKLVPADDPGTARNLSSSKKIADLLRA